MFQPNQYPAPLLTGQLSVQFTTFIIRAAGAPPPVAHTLQYILSPQMCIFPTQNWHLQYVTVSFCRCLNTEETTWCTRVTVLSFHLFSPYFLTAFSGQLSDALKDRSLLQAPFIPTPGSLHLLFFVLFCCFFLLRDLQIWQITSQSLSIYQAQTSWKSSQNK